MIGAAAKRFGRRLLRFPAFGRCRHRLAALRVRRRLDNDVERGYERPLIEDVTMARYSPFLNAMMLDTIELLSALTQAVA
jgi:hypothetical protein